MPSNHREGEVPLLRRLQWAFTECLLHGLYSLALSFFTITLRTVGHYTHLMGREN